MEFQHGIPGTGELRELVYVSWWKDIIDPSFSASRSSLSPSASRPCPGQAFWFIVSAFCSVGPRWLCLAAWVSPVWRALLVKGRRNLGLQLSLVSGITVDAVVWLCRRYSPRLTLCAVQVVYWSICGFPADLQDHRVGSHAVLLVFLTLSGSRSPWWTLISYWSNNYDTSVLFVFLAGEAYL